MPKTSTIAIAVGIALTLALSGCGSNDAEIEEFAKKHNLPENQAAAFFICAKSTQGKSLKFPVKDANLVMKSVPYEICSCHAGTLTAVFKGNKYSGYAGFFSYMASEKKKKLPRFRKKELAQGLARADANGRLQASLQSCIAKYRAANAGQAEKLFKVVPLPPEKEKKAKTKEAATSSS